MVRERGHRDISCHTQTFAPHAARHSTHQPPGAPTAPARL
jgi:hypothetical protein